MSAIDWNAVLTGAAAGMVLGALYFAGLALGMQRALQSANPVAVLTLSAAGRIALLLAAAWLVVGQAGAWSGAGFAGAFLVARFVAATYAKVSAP